MANVADATSEYVPSDTELDAEPGGDGLTHLVGGSPGLPLLELDDRHFEILAYLILREKVGTSTFYDAVSTAANWCRWAPNRVGVSTRRSTSARPSHVPDCSAP